MDSKQVLRFLADVATLAATHFGDEAPSSSPPAAEPEPPPSSSATRTPSSPEDQELISSLKEVIAGLMGCSLCGASGRKSREFARGQACISCLASAAPEALRAEYDQLLLACAAESNARQRDQQALAAERATNERLRAELVDAKGALAEVLREHAPLTRTRGRDIEAEIEVDFIQMVCGAMVPLRVEVDGQMRSFDVRVPPGIADGKKLGLRGRGGAGDPPGDIIVTVRVLPHPYLTRVGNDIVMHVTVPPDALERNQLSVETPAGPVAVLLSPENLGQTLRFEAKGIAPADGEAGDLLITLAATSALVRQNDAALPDSPSAAGAFASLQSLSAPAGAHLTTLANWSEDSSMHREIREVLWALAIAHERGAREPLRGYAAQLVDDLVAQGLLRRGPRARRSRVFAWLNSRSPLVTKEQSSTASLVLWKVHLEFLADPANWPHAEPRTITH